MAQGVQPAIARGPATEPEEPVGYDLAADPPEPAVANPAGLRRALAVFLALVAAGWIGLVAWTVAACSAVAAELVATSALAAAPLALMALLWLLLAPRPAAADRLRAEATALEDALAVATARIAAERRATAEQAVQLGIAGAEGARQIALSSAALGEETALIASRARDLADVAALARVDMGVVLADLPRAEAQVRLVGERLREAGKAAGEEADRLDQQLLQIAADSRQAEAGAGEAARSLTAELARIEAAGGDAGRGIAQVSAEMSRAADDALDRVARTIEAMRQAIEAEGEALGGMIERARVALASTGADRLADVDATLAALHERLARLSDRLDAEGQAGQALIGTLDRSLDAVDARVRAVGEAGADRTAELARTIARLDEQADGITRRLGDTAGSAGAELERRMAALSSLRAQIEEDTDKFDDAVQARGADSLARQVTRVIDGLNSTALDVARLLAGEVPDTVWGAYLRGDRGVFTRGAVRLLAAAEARSVLARYESDEAFRETVNRYVADFEAMLRRILRGGDDDPLGVTLLSSDMGKLYVALAQAIERLRG